MCLWHLQMICLLKEKVLKDSAHRVVIYSKVNKFLLYQDVQKMIKMGFQRNHCIEELRKSDGNIDQVSLQKWSDEICNVHTNDGVCFVNGLCNPRLFICRQLRPCLPGASARVSTRENKKLTDHTDAYCDVLWYTFYNILKHKPAFNIQQTDISASVKFLVSFFCTECLL